MGGYLRRVVEVTPGPSGAGSFHATSLSAALTDLYRGGELRFRTARSTAGSNAVGAPVGPGRLGPPYPKPTLR
jgi:hypothetical protein